MDEIKTNAEGANSRMGGDGFGGEDDDQYNKGVAFELQNERELIIKKKLKFEQQKREDDEKARRKARGN